MKKLLSLALSAVLALSLSVGVMAADEKLISTLSTLTVNGEKIDTSKMPKSEMTPIRAVVEADHGNVLWDAETNVATFITTDNSAKINLTTKEVSADDKILTENVPTFEIIDGVTFVSDSMFALFNSYKIVRSADAGTLDITTQNNTDIAKVAYKIQDEVEFGSVMRVKNANIAEYQKLDPSWFTEILCFTPMMVRSDTLYIGKVTEGNMPKVEEAFAAYQKQQIDTFTWYLGGEVLEIAQNGKIVKNGDYVMLVMSEDNDKAIEIFNTLK